MELMKRLREHYLSVPERLGGGAHDKIDDVNENVTRLCVDVHVSPLETYPLAMGITDDPKEVTEAFASRYNLSKSQHHQLLRLVETKLEELLHL
ncbi:hypothetical protein PINS_up008914 [Pythium insidiosum]|nr:hypothetical protein PINS_up008914 [Pythium insidiosum]